MRRCPTRKAHGGVAILVRRGYFAVERREVPVGWEGRVVLASAAVATGEEVVFCSVYLVTGKGLSEGNKCLVEAVGVAVQMRGRSFCARGDSQMLPEQLWASGFAQRLRAGIEGGTAQYRKKGGSGNTSF